MCMRSKTQIKKNKIFGKVKKRRIKDFNIDISRENSILTLSTCANNNKYMAVHHAVKKG